MPKNFCDIPKMLRKNLWTVFEQCRKTTDCRELHTVCSKCSASVIAKHNWTQWNRQTDGRFFNLRTVLRRRGIDATWEKMTVGVREWRRGNRLLFEIHNLLADKKEGIHIWRKTRWKTRSRAHWLFCWKETESRSLIRKCTAFIMNCTKISLSIKAFSRTAVPYDVGARRRTKGESKWRQIHQMFLEEKTAVLH